MTASYKTRAGAVRSAAQARLRALRAERYARAGRRGDTAGEASGTVSEAEAAAGSAPQVGEIEVSGDAVDLARDAAEARVAGATAAAPIGRAIAPAPEVAGLEAGDSDLPGLSYPTGNIRSTVACDSDVTAPASREGAGAGGDPQTVADSDVGPVPAGSAHPADTSSQDERAAGAEPPLPVSVVASEQALGAIAAYPDPRPEPAGLGPIDQAPDGLVSGEPAAAPRVDDGPAAEEGEAARDEATPAGETDLGRLPGIGPGLIWAFREAGVPDLASLARADADVLSGRLGLVGELLDLSGWISAARRLDARD